MIAALPEPWTWLLEGVGLFGGFVLLLGWPRALSEGRGLRWLLAAVTIVWVSVLLFDPSRWQLVPFHAIVVVAIGLGVLRLRRGYRQRPIWVRTVWGITALMLALIAGAPLALLPRFDLPPPRGPMPVGVADFHLIDKERSDPLFGGAREFMVRAWYPAGEGWEEEPAPYVSRNFAAALLDWQAPMVVFHHLPLVRTSGHVGLPVAPGKHPVVVFLPGYQSFNAQSTTLAQDLASNGYVVLSIGSPGDAMAVEFPDGKVRNFRRYKLLEQLGALNVSATAFEGAIDPSEGARLAQEINRKVPEAQQALALIGADVNSVLDRVEHGGLGVLDERLDASQVAIVGMSFGGATAAMVCSRDPRCKAGVNLDGFMFGDLHAREIGRPFMVIANGTFGPVFFNDTFGRAPVRPADAPTRIDLQVRGSRHGDFSDLALYAPLAKRFIPNAAVGSIDGHRMLGLTSDLVLSFLDKEMHGRPNALVVQIKLWREVTWRDVPLPSGWQTGRLAHERDYNFSGGETEAEGGGRTPSAVDRPTLDSARAR